ncbi:YrhC family protein [Bacillus sp. H-16]|uniref:YrhC family protein n=1 Tax=Alteribacter salitolerans TaxID=2912333 RepID=UPI0019669FAA|nr:YrhC family protein [Alteribacter salitolerans]MBM7097177.1 YrhC family protein [Alteribacter salitolerans]
MSQQQVETLKAKVTDYRRYAFVMLALSIFMFVGILIPNEALAAEHQPILMGMNVVALLAAVVFHRIAMGTEKKLHEDE